MKERCELLDDAPRGVTNAFLQIINLLPMAVEINSDIWRLSDCRLDKVTKYVEGMFQTP